MKIPEIVDSINEIIIVFPGNEYSDTFVKKCEGLVYEGYSVFVCYGKLSEYIHDALDDALIIRGGRAVTTWHDDESPKDVSSMISILPNLTKHCGYFYITGPSLGKGDLRDIQQFKELLPNFRKVSSVPPLKME